MNLRRALLPQFILDLLSRLSLEASSCARRGTALYYFVKIIMQGARF
jgi:hypothetical protein